MKDLSNNNILNDENDVFSSNEARKFIDIHCHCISGIDDGPSTISESISLCKALADDNIAVVAATPHQLGRYDGMNDAQTVRDAVDKFNSILKDLAIPLKIVSGGEIRADERICQLIKDDKILTIADGHKYILIELPHQVFIDIEPLIQELISMDIYPIISHAERVLTLTKNPDILSRWIEKFAYLQITAASLLGDFGLEMESASWNLLNSGLAHFVATDSHNINTRKPRMKDAYKNISSKLGEDFANMVCIDNPLRVMQGRDIVSKSVFDESRMGV